MLKSVCVLLCTRVSAHAFLLCWLLVCSQERCAISLNVIKVTRCPKNQYTCRKPVSSNLSSNMTHDKESKLNKLPNLIIINHFNCNFVNYLTLFPSVLVTGTLLLCVGFSWLNQTEQLPETPWSVCIRYASKCFLNSSWTLNDWRARGWFLLHSGSKHCMGKTIFCCNHMKKI